VDFLLNVIIEKNISMVMLMEFSAIKDMDTNEHEKLSNITLRHKIPYFSKKAFFLEETKVVLFKGAAYV
jgi:hypothetical protein